MKNAQETIFALSSAFGKAGVSVFRISGDNSLKILKSLTKKTSFKPNEMQFAKLYDGKKLLDESMVVFFKSPHSFTGENSAELFTHGSVAVIDSIYKALENTGFARLATPGGFSRRAFANGKLNLAQVESLADLIDSETESQRQLALKNMSSEAGKIYKNWRTKIVKILSFAEAQIDFSEDELPQNIARQIAKEIENLTKEISAHLTTSSSARRIKHGVDIAIIGKPNTGKSSLFNKLVGDSRAIVSSTAGTTRDILETPIDIDGVRINLLDTAGLRKKTNSSIEKIGIKKALKAAEIADIKIHLITNKKEIPTSLDDKTILVFNKIDKAESPKNILGISIKTDQNYDKFLTVLKEKIHKLTTHPTDTVLSQKRHESALKTALQELQNAASQDELDLKSEHLRYASDAIASITGEVYFNELLDNIFSAFCLGK